MKMKNYRSLFVLFLLFAIKANAQQRPQYTQYVLNNYILNPALSGIENYTDVKISHRQQWVGLTDAPVTTYFSIQTPLGKKDDKLTATSFSMSGENLRGKDYDNEYSASAPHHGVGLQIVNDRFGPFNRFSAMATYAYHIGLSPKTNLSAGLGVGVSKLSLNTGKLYFGPTTPIDPAVTATGALGKSNLDISAGMWLYGSNYFVGFSSQQLLPQKIDFSPSETGVTKGTTVPHMFITAGRRFNLNEDVSILPSIMIKSVQPVPMQTELNVKLQYQELFWGGASYRFKYGFAAMAGVNIFNGITVSYSYDYSTTKLNTVSSGTHEILLGFIIGNKRTTETCPRRVW